MTLRPAGFRTTLLILAALAAMVGCDDGKKPAEASTWTYESAKAPYAVQLPAEWTMEEPERLNSYADLAASYGDDDDENALFLIVIPQPLPALDGVEPPDELALKRASISVMQEEIADFEVVRQGPVRVADHEGQTVFARGVVDERPVSYVTTYLTHDGWGFQIIAWGPREREQAVVAHVDHLLNRWRFTSPSKPPAPRDIQRPATAGEEPDEANEPNAPDGSD